MFFIVLKRGENYSTADEICTVYRNGATIITIHPSNQKFLNILRKKCL